MKYCRALSVVLILGIKAFALAAAPAPAVVINEIHYNPDVKTERVEFIEIFNRGTSAVNLAGWRFTEGVEFTFPATNLAAGGYLVVSQNPAAVQTKFGVASIGPYVGALQRDGETLTLRDAASNVVDSVDFQLGFPWPTVGDPPGYSIELIHPTFDNDLGGSWRASVAGGILGTTNQIFPAGSSWKYFKGFSEASSPTTLWRARTFNDSGWVSGPAPIGYGENFIATPLPDMRSNYTTIFLRREFVVNDLGGVGSLLLEAQFDDGFQVWINGFKVIDGQANMPPGDVAFSGTASSALENFTFRSYVLNNPTSYLVPGTNVIAIQAANSDLRSSTDFFVDFRLSAFIGPANAGPTPGRLNAAFATNAPPQIRQVDHSPNQPRSGQAVLISAKITDPEGVTSVSLQYQLVDPGSYVELTEAAYTNNWVTVTMNDSGTGGDLLPGDSVYSAQLPGSLQQHRRLVRYRISATDGRGASVRVPYPDDPQPNFAYFVYNGVPAWSGAHQPGFTPPVTYGTNITQRFPVYHLISKNSSVITATGWNPGAPNNRYGGDLYLWTGTLVYDGKVYDHIHYRARGGVWRYAMGKNMWKMDFNRGHDFEARDNWGRKYRVGWTKLNLGASIQQGDFGHRGEQGMFESVGFRLFNLAGVESPHTHFAQFRIIDAAQESNPANQYEGDFWGLYLAVEQEDGRFLEEHDLADGNLYKMESGTGELNNLSPFGPANKSDLNSFLSTYNSSTNSDLPDSWWRTNLNLPKYFNYQAMVQGVHHYDIADGKNYFYYRNPTNGLWEVHTWDLDLTWADNMYRGGQQGGDEPFKSRVLSNFSTSPARPAIAIEFRNRIREIRDLLYNTDQAYKLIDEYARLLRGTNLTGNFLDADRAMWDFNPVMVDGSIVNTGKAGQGRFYQFNEPVSQDFNGTIQLMKNYVAYRASDPNFSLDTISADAARPNRPTATYLGTTNYSLNELRFRSSVFSGNGGGFASMKWRMGEVTDPNSPSYDPTEPHVYEIEPVWESGDLPVFASDIQVPAGAVKVGHRYRLRVQMRDNTGRTSNWSLPVEFTVGEPAGAAALLSYLRISEVMYNPAAGSEFEFIELHNTSSQFSLNLEGARLTQGVDYAFPAGVTLPPGGYLLVVGTTNLTAFRNHYGLSGAVPIFGPWTGSLNNAGEEIVLRTAAGGTDIVVMEYSDDRGWASAADGTGHSLVVVDASEGAQTAGSADYGGNWRPSTYLKGSPGGPETAPARTVVLNEITAHTDYSNPARPEYDSNDWIELYNAGSSNVLLSGWYLSDDANDLRKWAIPAITLAPGQFVAFDEVTGFHNPITIGFGLDKAGERVFLSHLPGNASDRVVDAIQFEGQENDFSWGRYPDGAGDWGAMARTQGTNNLPPPAGLVINEIVYHPLPSALYPEDNSTDELVEIWNPTAQPISLFNTNGNWRIEGGIDFNFPANTTVPANGFLLLVNFNPTNGPMLTEFRRVYGLTNSSVPILGPYSGKLDNQSDRVAIARPQAPDVAGGAISWVLVDEAIYANQLPWSPGPGTNGQSLQRLSATDHGNDPSNWGSAAITAGRINGVGNRPPVFTPVGAQSVSELSPYQLVVTATDPDLPTNQIAYHLVSGPSGLGFNPTTRTLSWTPQEVDGPGNYPVVVRATDNGNPPMSADLNFNLAVLEANQAPQIQDVPASGQVIGEGTTFVYTNRAVDFDQPANAISFSLDQGAPGASIDSQSGRFTWTPGLEEGPTNYVFIVRVTDNGSPAGSATASFSLLVGEVNRPPALDPIPNQSVLAGGLVSVQLRATDPDLPTNQISYAIASAPPGVTIGSESGLFQWQPGAEFAGTNQIRLLAVDNGAPSLSATQSFLVIVTTNARPQLNIRPGPGLVIFNWEAAPNTGYALEQLSEVEQAGWLPWTNFPAEPGARQISVTNTPSTPRRFFRLRIE